MSAAQSFFGGSYGGDDSQLADTTRLECKICWYLYDPAQGDETQQVPPGTPFAALPDDWSCPVCAGPRQDFLVIEDDGNA